MSAGRGVKGGRKKERIKLILILSQNFQINFMQINNIHKSCFTTKFEYIYLILYIHFLLFEENAGNIGH